MQAQPDILRLIDSIYEGALSDRAWQESLRLLARMVDGTGMLLMVFDPVAGAPIRLDNINLDTQLLDAYGRYWAYHDPRLEPALSVPVGEIMTERSLVPRDRWFQSPIYNELLVPNDVTQCLVVWLEKAPRRAASISIQRPHNAPPFGEREFAVVRQAIPHLRRSLGIKDRLGFSHCRVQSILEVMDRLPFGVVLLDKDQRVIDASTSARELLTNRDGITSENGHFRCVDSRNARALAQAFAQRLTPTNAKSAANSVVVRRASGFRPLTLVVIPSSAADGLFASQHAVACVLVFDPEISIEPPTDMVRRTLGLSAAEASLVTLLANGLSLREAADQLDVSLNTARTQLKSTFVKTDCHGQRALLRRVATGPALLWSHRKVQQRGKD